MFGFFGISRNKQLELSITVHIGFLALFSETSTPHFPKIYILKYSEQGSLFKETKFESSHIFGQILLGHWKFKSRREIVLFADVIAAFICTVCLCTAFNFP